VTAVDIDTLSQAEDLRSLSYRTYYVRVQTGEVGGHAARPEGELWCEIKGSSGGSGPLLLGVSDQEHKFQPGQVDSFRLRLAHLGYVDELAVTVKGGSGTWFVETVVVHEDRSAWAEDGTRSVERDAADRFCFPVQRALVADGAPQLLVLPMGSHLYHITFHTGNVRNADASAPAVALELHGDRASSGLVVFVRSASGAFARAHADAFERELRPLGRLERVHVRQCGGERPWFVEKIVVIDMGVAPGQHRRTAAKARAMAQTVQAHAATASSASGVATTFVGNCWVDSTGCELGASVPAATTIYTVSVVTGDVRFGGTDAAVHCTLWGRDGCSGYLVLDKFTAVHRKKRSTGMKFERGATDSFQFSLVDVGELTAMEIGHDESTIGSGWFLDKVIVCRVDDGKLWTFHANRWLDVSEGDHLTECTLFPGSRQYTLQFITGDLPFAGTDANVSCVLRGEGGESGVLHLGNSSEHADKFERGQTDSFDFNMKVLSARARVRACVSVSDCVRACRSLGGSRPSA
jgi:hypothetical protein